MVHLSVDLQEFRLEIRADGPKDFLKEAQRRIIETTLAVFGDEHQMNFQIKYTMTTVP